jgi:hypothetical protein
MKNYVSLGVIAGIIAKNIAIIYKPKSPVNNHVTLKTTTTTTTTKRPNMFLLESM